MRESVEIVHKELCNWESTIQLWALLIFHAQTLILLFFLNITLYPIAK